MKIQFTPRADQKHWLISDSLGYQGRRAVITRFWQKSSENSKLLKALRKVARKVGVYFLRTYKKDPYDTIGIHQQVGTAIAKKIAPLPDEYGEKQKELQDAEHEEHELSKQETILGGEKGQVDNVIKQYHSDYTPVRKQEITLSYPEDRSPTFTQRSDSSNPEEFEKHLHAQGNWHGNDTKRRIIGGTKWSVFPPLMEYIRKRLPAIGKKNLLSYYSNGKTVLLTCIVLLVEVGEIFFVVTTLAINWRLTGIEKYLMAGVPLSLAIMFFFLSKKQIGDWLRRSIHFSWRELPSWVVLAFLLMIINVTSIGLMARDTEKIDQFILEERTRKENKKKKPKTFSFKAENPQVADEESKARKLPERSFEWANTVLYLLLGVSLAGSAGVTSAFLFHISKLNGLRRKIRKLKKEGKTIRQVYDEGREDLGNVLKSMEICIHNYGFILYLEGLISWRLGDQEVRQMMQADKVHHNGSSRTIDEQGTQSVSNLLNQELS